MKKRLWLIPLVLVLIGALVAFVGIGSMLAVGMDAGGPTPSAPEVAGRQFVLWALCALTGALCSIVSVVRLAKLAIRGMRGGE